jgi:hypothetical protein
MAIAGIVSATLLMLGIVGMLETRLEETVELTVITVHPVTAVVWLVMGLVGIAMSTVPARARRYLLGAGCLLTLWGLLCLVLDGSPSDVFARDAALVVLLLVGGVLSLGAALARPVPPPERVPG